LPGVALEAAAAQAVAAPEALGEHRVDDVREVRLRRRGRAARGDQALLGERQARLSS
jgi:hypothetical protein